jgi:hypothetical protein
MLFLTKCFGVTGSDAERNFAAEKACTAEIVERVLEMQANAAAKQQCPLRRGTHAKGVTARAQFQVFDVTAGRDPASGARLARGIFARPATYPAVVRFANSDSYVNSDFKADVRALSISVDLSGNRTAFPGWTGDRQDFTLQSARTLPLNDAPAFLAVVKMLTASSPAKALLALSLRDKLRVLRTLALLQAQARKPVKPYQQLRYWSTVPFRHGPIDVVKQSAIPCPDNPSHPLQRRNSDALQDELLRHLKEDSRMSSFDFALQFLDAEKMTYWGGRQDASFWIENASVRWKESQAPFHKVARLTLMPGSSASEEDGETTYFDVTGHSAPDSLPIGSINRARWPAEVASREARMCPGQTDSHSSAYAPHDIPSDAAGNHRMKRNEAARR